MRSPAPASPLHELRVIKALSLPGLIRLVTEIDDHGPISHQYGSLQGAFGDLTPGQLRHAINTARDLGLVHADEQAPDRYRLTESGEDLAEVYDTAARWARAHQYPSDSSDFVTRVQHTLQLPAPDPASEADSDHSGVGTDRPQPPNALADWLETHPHVLNQAASRSSRSADETGLAA
ncbi:hypothetical protein ACFYN0_01120 [Streptomyces sp. NPDC006704]|uniref:hypothetical protein n=1 Tax=Streptomyces sp. NPDC006704 TaxID=3364760 RepID=UPI0036CD6104